MADTIRDKLENSLADRYRNELAQDEGNDHLNLFRHIKENQIFYRTYFKLGYDDNYKIIAYDTELAKKYFQNKFIEYHMAFFKSGITKIIKMWLENEKTGEERRDPASGGFSYGYAEMENDSIREDSQVGEFAFQAKANRKTLKNALKNFAKKCRI